MNVAPAGFGKTTLLAEWSTRDPALRVGVRERHSGTLLRSLALAIHNSPASHDDRPRGAGEHRTGYDANIPSTAAARAAPC